MKGHTYKRCPCGVVTDADDRRVNCNKRHGSWFFIHDLPPDASGKRRQARKGGFATEREARKALNDALSRIDQGSYVKPTRQSVGEYLDQWLDGKGKLRASTRRSYREHIDLYLKPGLGHVRLVELREVHIERLYAAMAQLGFPAPEHSHELDRILAARAAPACAPNAKSAVASASAVIAFGAKTETEATPLSAGRPACGSMIWP